MSSAECYDKWRGRVRRSSAFTLSPRASARVEAKDRIMCNSSMSRRHSPRLLLALSLVLSLFVSVLWITPAMGAPAGLVAAYSFDQGSGTTVPDASGTNNTGTLAGATWTTSGKYGGALAFNGTNQRVNIPNAASLQLSSAMTLEAWVNPSTISNVWRDVVFKGNDNYYLMATTGPAHAGTPAGGAIVNGAHAEAFGTTTLTTGTFTHLAATYDGATLKLYVGGNLVGSKAATGAIMTSTNQLQIGGDSIYGQYFAGVIDEVRVYNTALTQAQIQTDMTTPIGSGGSSDTQKPTPPPSSLTATPVSSSQINLAWTAASDNVGVTSYRIERCQGTGCATTPSNFVQIGTVNGTPPATTYNNSTGLAANTPYSYRILATDAVPNLSDYSNVATATTQGGGGGGPAGLVAYYSFDQGSGTTVTDVSGNNNTGSIVGATWTTSGKFNGALSFDGTNQRVDIPNTASLQLSSAMTLEAWVKPSTVSNAWRDVIFKGNDNYYLMATTGPAHAGTPAGGAIVNGAHTEAFGTGVLPTGTFTHLAATYDGATLKLYVGGTLVGSKAATGAITTSTNPLQIGGDSIYSQYFAGVIDEVRIYNTALTQAQIQTDMGVPPPPPSDFVNETLATGFNLPTTLEFLPDGRMLVAELQGKIWVLPPPYTTPNPTPFLQLTNVGSAGVQQGIYDLVLDPGFTTNHYYYVFYTLGTPNRDRLSRFTANASLTGTVSGSEAVLYQDPQDANAEHHGGALAFGNDGKLYFTTGEHFLPALSQDLTNPRGKIHRINPDGTVPTDNPFYDGSGPHWDSIWALGLRNPFRAYYDAPTGRFFVGDVGGNVASTAVEEIELGARGANYGWPDSEGSCASPCTSPIYSWPHNNRDSAVVAGFVYHGTQFPSSYVGSFFFADYAQNWIKRLTLDANGHVTGVFNFEPTDGAPDGPTGDVVYLAEGPDGALYYVDLGYSDTTSTAGISKIRRIRYVGSNQPPIVSASATPTSGTAPLPVSFSSAGSSDPEGQPVTYLWTFGDNTTSTAANPSHTYTQAGAYSARLALSDGVNTTYSSPISISVGSKPVATITSPSDGSSFRAGDVISFNGTGTDPEDGALPASAFTWNIDLLHDGHIHPGTPITGVKSGTFIIPATGHDFTGNVRYRFTLAVKDSSGLTSTTSVIIWPQKVNLTFNTVPSGLTLYIDGIAQTTPFVMDDLIGFNDTIEARNQTVGTTNYSFASWSDGGAQQHVIVVPTTDSSYTATYTASSGSATPTFVQVNSATPQTNQSTVKIIYTGAQTAGNTNILAIGWNDATSNISSVTDTAGNTYQVAAPTARGTGLSQAIYYAKNIKAAPAGGNTVTVTFTTAVRFADIRISEYSGLSVTNPLDVTASASGTVVLANSGNVTTTSASELIFGAGHHREEVHRCRCRLHATDHHDT